MQLKKLQLTGFKTFADKTEIEIGDGLTAVVGPNGSGKSNIADAILWVMGEQNPRLLRGSESRDVIFAGTDKRKPLGMAEVRLTLDNSDSSLPVEFAEVSVARRVFRSGESQYLLNNAPCRMKDIVDLFLDTGVGKGAYSFVSQSEIDAVLSAKPEDRRELFEEAAGIKKYRVKKREAVRKLDQAEANLTRVRDIIRELETQRDPLAEQAELAKRYREMTTRLREIEVDLLVAEVQKADYELYAARQEREMDLEAVRKLDADLARMEDEATVIGADLAKAEQESDSARLTHQTALTTAERTESQLQLVAERGANAELSAESLDIELIDLRERISLLKRTIDQQEVSLQKSEAEETLRKQKLGEAKKRLSQLDVDYTEAARLAQDHQSLLLRLAEQRAQREAALGTTTEKLAQTELRLRQVSAEIKDATSQIRLASDNTCSLDKRIADFRDAEAKCSSERERVEGERRKLRDIDSQFRAKLDAARRTLAEQTTRLTTLNELQESGEGFFQGVRAVLKANRNGALKGNFSAAVDLLKVPEEFRVAVEVALGGSLQDIICDTEEEAKSAIEWLKRERAGRATFLALPALRPGTGPSAKDLRTVRGLVGVASELVGTESKYSAALQLLLGRVIVAEDMQSALAASRKLQGWSRIVTLEGEVVTPGGALTGGSLQSKGAHLVGRKGEIDDLRAFLPESEKVVHELFSRLEDNGTRIEKAETQLSELVGEASRLSSGLTSTMAEKSALQRDWDRLASLQKDLEAEQKRLQSVHESLLDEQAKWKELASGAEADDGGTETAIRDAQRRAAELAAERDKARADSVRLEISVGQVAEQRTSLARECDSNRRMVLEHERTRETKLAQRELAGARFAEADTLKEELERKLIHARAHLSEWHELAETWKVRVQELRNRSFEAAGSIKRTSQERSRITQNLHESELQSARLEVKLAQVAERLEEEYGISQQDALERPEPESMEKSTVTEIGRLRREIRSMGDVNTGAVEEYERLTERHEFLDGQNEDLERARESLLATITEIDESTRGVFMETFDAVADTFSQMFKRLFNGGSTKLILTTPDDLLETGIDIIAQPPGKKAQQLSLLSGGERALTAVALLFSFLAVRPSPFCVLDEVDAPLDGPNVEKFVNLVREFSRNTQFLVITHNPTTMEASPRWYGVTMQEPGISRILSYKVPDEAVVTVVDSPIAAPQLASNGRS